MRDEPLRLRYERFQPKTTGNLKMTPMRSSLHPSTLGLLGRARHTLVAAAVATALGVISAPVMSAEPASAADLQNLQDQIQKLQREVERMKAAQTQTAPAPAPAAKPAPGAAAPAPSFMAGPVKVTLGGFRELMVVNRSRHESADRASNFHTSI